VSPPVRFVLVRPRNPLNVGAAARAVANFGFSELCAVEPHAPVWKEATSAVGAEALLRRAPALTLDAALEGAHLILGTHDGRRRGGPVVVELPALREWLAARSPAGGRLAVLFGCEKSGLSNVELDRCHAAVRIPTSAGCPSMNLAQAVAVVAYELAARPAPPPAEDLPAMTHEQREAFVAQALGLCRALGYRAGDPDEVLERALRAVLLRRPLSRDEAALLQALLRRLPGQSARIGAGGNVAQRPGRRRPGVHPDPAQG